MDNALMESEIQKDLSNIHNNMNFNSILKKSLNEKRKEELRNVIAEVKSDRLKESQKDPLFNTITTVNNDLYMSKSNLISSLTQSLLKSKDLREEMVKSKGMSTHQAERFRGQLCLLRREKDELASELKR